MAERIALVGKKQAKRRTNPTQRFVRAVIFLGIAGLLILLVAIPTIIKGIAREQLGRLMLGLGEAVLFIWLGMVAKNVFHVLSEWERMVLLRLGKFAGVKGPGLFLVPPFIYSIAEIVDTRIVTYQIKATRTLTEDNVPVDVTAAIEMEVEDPRKAVIAVKDYMLTTEWSATEALKSMIGSTDLRSLLGEPEQAAATLKSEIDKAAQDYGVNVRAVRITDVVPPADLIQELAVIARAKRSAEAKRIEAEAEKKVADATAEAARVLAEQEGAMELRHIQALLEISKEESATIIVYPVQQGRMGAEIAAAAAGTRS